jgi:hypothetical protein
MLDLSNSIANKTTPLAIVPITNIGIRQEIQNLQVAILMTCTTITTIIFFFTIFFESSTATTAIRPKAPLRRII